MKTQLTWNANRAWLGFFSGERHNALTACATRATQSIISRMCPLTLIYVCPRIMMKLAGMVENAGTGYTGTGIRVSDIRIYGYTDIRIYGYTGIRIYGYTGIRVYGYTGIRVYGYTGIRVYGNTGIRIYGYTGTKFRYLVN